MSDFSDDFMLGQKICAAGYPCSSDASEAFQRGYSTEYSKQEAITGMQVERDNERLRKAK